MDEMKREESVREGIETEPQTGTEAYTSGADETQDSFKTMETEKQRIYVEPKTPQTDPEKKTLSIAALVLGIVGIVFDFIYLWIGLIAGIVGIIIGAKARKDENAKGMATAGFICSIVAVVMAGLLLACAICAIGTIAAGLATGMQF